MRIAIVVGLGLAASVASAGGISTSIQIGKWTIESSECLWAGQRHTSYPIWKMFDGRPDTAWVFSGVGYPKLSPKDEGNGVEKGIRLKLVPSHPVVIDELRLMNGYNKSEDLYYKNSRVAEISIFESEMRDTVSSVGRVVTGWIEIVKGDLSWLSATSKRRRTPVFMRGIGLNKSTATISSGRPPSKDTSNSGRGLLKTPGRDAIRTL